MTILTKFDNTLESARLLDKNDELSAYRDYFHIPKNKQNQDVIYLAGNSLGLAPKICSEYINEVLSDWRDYGVEGHFKAKNAWMPYHELVTEGLSNLTKAVPNEVVAMNSLTVNLHLMLVSFYRPNSNRYKILIESNTFPSDKYAVASQARFHGYDDKDAIIEFKSSNGDLIIPTVDIIDTIEKNKDILALILIGQPNYLTGQAFDLDPIIEMARKYKIPIGLNLAHGIGNLNLDLHALNVDFAVWCSYKYLNSGPGGIAGLFIHERHHRDVDRPKFCGWWGHNQRNRFTMPGNFESEPGAYGYQLSNPPIFQLAALRASLDIFNKAKIDNLRRKSINLTNYLEFLLKNNPKTQALIKVITPSSYLERGSQLSLQILNTNKNFVENLQQNGIIADFREPDIIRFAPVALYNTYTDVYNCVKILGDIL